jgi:hypothetical protein
LVAEIAVMALSGTYGTLSTAVYGGWVTLQVVEAFAMPGTAASAIAPLVRRALIGNFRPAATRHKH